MGYLLQKSSKFREQVEESTEKKKKKSLYKVKIYLFNLKGLFVL